ncbi:AtpZ/AtpI family protein [Azospirillum sp.]|uniref:AtpZ/AtpI family protein n=1 Tax=Azospirillum sp. TaxID=34012 RepID=UPI002D4CB53C|nr:AtpZ/AtpI family protein [Azospirillum sp.]HYD64486.1 AtpZ/AtpI family protein [Azospirillum sp.]
MSDGKPPHSLDELEARLRKARDAQAEKAGPSRFAGAPQGPIGVAWRIGVELVAAMIVGVGGGYLLDRWLGTAPWGLVVMFFLGAAAGILNVYRAFTGLGYATGYGREEDNGRPDGDGH